MYMPDTDTTHSEGTPSSPGDSCGSRQRRCPLLPAFFKCFSLLRTCVQQLRGRSPLLARPLLSCPQLHAGHIVIGVSDLVILFLLLLISDMMPDIISLLLRVGIPLNVLKTLAAVCLWLKLVALRIADDCPDSGSDSERKMTCSERMNKGEQIMKVEREVQTCNCLPLKNEFDECLATSQRTDSRVLSHAAMYQLNNDDDLDERRIEHLNIHTYESSEDPSVQQTCPQASSTDLQISSAASGMPENDVNVAQEDLPVDHDRKLPANRQNSTDIQIQNITAAFEKSLKTVKTFKTKHPKRMFSKLNKKTRISQSHPKNSEHEKKEPQPLEQMMTMLEDRKGVAKSDPTKHLMSLCFIPQTQEQVYTCAGPQNGLHHEMWTEESRLASFSMHPAVPPSGVWVTQLAAAGFFCLDRNSSKVRCAFCSVEVDIISFRRRPPLEVHLALSPSCPLVKGEAPNRSLEERRQRVSRQYIDTFFGSGALVAPAAIAQSHHQEKETSGSGSRKETQGAAVQFGDQASSQLVSSGQPPEHSFQSQARHNSASGTAFVSHPPRGEELSQYSGSSQQSCSSSPLHATGLQPADFPSVPLTPALLPSAGTEQRSTAHEHVPPAQPTHQMSQAPDQTLSAEPSRNGGPQNSHLALPAQDASTSRTEGNRETTPTFQTAQLDERHEDSSSSPNTDTAAAAIAAATSAAHSSQSSTTNESERQVVTYAQLGIYTQEPKRPDLAIANTRVGTYANWSHSATHSPEDMAEAGFYFVGVEDLVRCFYCKGGLKSWSRSLRPWVEHARFYPRCPFVGQVKGQEFIEVVQQLNENQEEISDAKVEEELKRRQLAASEQGVTHAGTGATERGEEGMEMEQSHLGAGGGGAEDGARARAAVRPGAEAEVDETHLKKTADELENENLEIIHERICKICQVEEVSILFLPCGHLVSCSQCAPALRTCAVCRQRVKGRVRVLDDKTTKHPDDHEPEIQS